MLLAEAMRYIYPAVYSSQFPKHFVERFPFLQQLTGLHRKEAIILPISQKAKNLEKAHVYSDLIAPQMRISIYTETWMNGAGDLPSRCATQYKVINIEKLNIGGTAFANSHDHSKWAVAMDSSEPVLCIGDINRQDSQAKRGGGAVCFENQHIWSLYHSSIVDSQKCSVKKHRNRAISLARNLDRVSKTLSINRNQRKNTLTGTTVNDLLII
ncbi:unnamed protein product [Gongylonema pulchrum]|uniref:Deoxyribonuclease II n=1 Tax=Gongylonema pulchrum TaxID=637853 RepID=A0A183D699_9BILA|nr:unnamed protein product [Gongylonema pulchrum]